MLGVQLSEALLPAVQNSVIRLFQPGPLDSEGVLIMIRGHINMIFLPNGARCMAALGFTYHRRMSLTHAALPIAEE